MRLGKIPETLRHIGLGVLHGGVLIVTDRKVCVLHRDLDAIKQRFQSPEDAKREPRKDPEPLDDPLFTQLIDEGREGTTPAYVDPVTGTECLAAYAPVPPYGWGVVVQHERQEVLKPVSRLRTWMESWGIVIFATMSLATTGLWGGLIWTLRKEERPEHG
jgi:hypothetical protein